MAERFFARVMGVENASTEMQDLIDNQGVVKSTITTTPIDTKHLMVTFFNDIPVVAEASGATTTYTTGTDEPTWADLVEVTDGDHASGHTLAIDTSAVDMVTVGTFKVGYVATDSSGNDSALFELTITIEEEV